MHTTLSTTIARAAAVAGLSALAVLPSACAQQDDAAGCKDLPVPEVQQAIVLLAPGSGDALASAVSSLGSGSGEPLAAAGLGLAPASDGGDAPPATAVVLATYDDRGNVDPHGTFVLTGRGNDDRVRQRSARHEAQCLEEAASALPSAGAEAHPDLLRSLDRASGLGSQEAGAPRTSIVAIGLGTSAIDGRRVRLVTASALSFPDCTCGVAASAVGNAAAICLLITSMIAGASPLYGICSMEAPKAEKSSSPAR